MNVDTQTINCCCVVVHEVTTCCLHVNRPECGLNSCRTCSAGRFCCSDPTTGWCCSTANLLAALLTFWLFSLTVGKSNKRSATWPQIRTFTASRSAQLSAAVGKPPASGSSEPLPCREIHRVSLKENHFPSHSCEISLKSLPKLRPPSGLYRSFWCFLKLLPNRRSSPPSDRLHWWKKTNIRSPPEVSHLKTLTRSEERR